MLYKSLPESIRLHPRYQEAAKDLETKILDDADNPLDNTTSGRVEHNERVNKSVETILRNEDTTVPERPTTTIIYNDNGIANIEASHFPLDANNKSQISLELSSNNFTVLQ